MYYTKHTLGQLQGCPHFRGGFVLYSTHWDNYRGVLISEVDLYYKAYTTVWDNYRGVLISGDGLETVHCKAVLVWICTVKARSQVIGLTDTRTTEKQYLYGPLTTFHSKTISV